MRNKLPGLGPAVARVKMHHVPGLGTLTSYLLGGQEVIEQVHQRDFNDVNAGQPCSVFLRRE